MEAHPELIPHRLGKALHPSLSPIKGPPLPFSQDRLNILQKKRFKEGAFTLKASSSESF